jgi:hypothetical protein
VLAHQVEEVNLSQLFTVKMENSQINLVGMQKLRASMIVYFLLNNITMKSS